MTNKDPFSEAYTDELYDDQPVINDKVGGPHSIATPGVGRKPNRKGLFIILGVVLFLVTLVVLAKTKSSNAPEEPTAAVDMTESAVAKSEEDLSKEALSKINEANTDNLQQEETSQELFSAEEIASLQYEDSVRIAQTQTGQRGNAWVGGAPAAPSLGTTGTGTGSSPEVEVPGLTVGQQTTPANNTQVSPDGAPAAQPQNAQDLMNGSAGNVAAIDPRVAAEDARIQAEMRRKEAAEERAKRRAEERERLKKSTLLASATSGNSTTGQTQDPAVAAGLQEALGDEDAQKAMALLNNLQGQGAMGETSPGAPNGGPTPSSLTPSTGQDVDLSELYGITPGTSVPAVTTSQFVSTQAAAGLIEARLTSPLRVRGSVLLPAGTLAYGKASATLNNGSGRVNVQFSTFVTPSRRVIRIGGQAVDPRTKSLSIRGRVDHNLLSRIARAGAVTALDYALTSGEGERTRSIYEQPSSRDEAVRAARERLNGILGSSLGGENDAQTPAVVLPEATPIFIIFGLSSIGQ